MRQFVVASERAQYAPYNADFRFLNFTDASARALAAAYDTHVAAVRAYFAGRTRDFLELRVDDNDKAATLARFLGLRRDDVAAFPDTYSCGPRDIAAIRAGLGESERGREAIR